VNKNEKHVRKSLNISDRHKIPIRRAIDAFEKGK
jgi:hypothetical protein